MTSLTEDQKRDIRQAHVFDKKTTIQRLASRYCVSLTTIVAVIQKEEKR